MIDSIRAYLQDIFGDSGLSWASFLFQMALIFAGTLFFYVKIIKNSPVEKTVKGIVIFLFTIWIIGEFCAVFHLRILSSMLKNMILLIILSGVVLFQPELRRLMARLGNNFSFSNITRKKEMTLKLMDILIQTITYWRKNKTGALIVFENLDPVKEFTNAGYQLDAVLSSELLINLFFVNTPLHDGAVLIKNNRIISAGLILPLTKQDSLTWQYGTRHRAAIGLSENTDALCLVISEETGDVSFIRDGKIKSLKEMSLIEKELSHFISPLIKKETEKSLWKRIKELGKNTP